MRRLRESSASGLRLRSVKKPPIPEPVARQEEPHGSTRDLHGSNGGSGSCRGLSGGKILNDLFEGFEASEITRLNDRSIRNAFLEGRENLDALDRVDTQIRFHVHL